jgi:hypothetical protein
MTKKTTKTLVVSSVFAVTTVGVLVAMVFILFKKEEKLISLQTTIAEQRAKEQAARNISQLIEDTVTTRETVASFFVAEKDTISFIAEIEALAIEKGVSLKTTGLDLRPAVDAQPAELQTQFSVFGSRLAVIDFMTALETLPYHSRLPKWRITSRDGKTYESSIDIFVTITP